MAFGGGTTGNPETGRFEAEYAKVYGVPFEFIPDDRQIPSRDPKPVLQVRAPERKNSPSCSPS